jgi:hypothetical protein
MSWSNHVSGCLCKSLRFAATKGAKHSATSSSESKSDDSDATTTLVPVTKIVSRKDTLNLNSSSSDTESDSDGDSENGSCKSNSSSDSSCSEEEAPCVEEKTKQPSGKSASLKSANIVTSAVKSEQISLHKRALDANTTVESAFKTNTNTKKKIKVEFVASLARHGMIFPH